MVASTRMLSSASRIGSSSRIALPSLSPLAGSTASAASLLYIHQRSTASPSTSPLTSPPSPPSSYPSSKRTYASHSTFNPPPTLNPFSIFDPRAKSLQRSRAIARLREQGHEPSLVDYVREEIAERLAERVEDLREKPGRVVEVQGHKGELTRVLQEVLGDELEEKVIDVSEKEGGKVGRREWVVMEDSDALHADEFDFPVERIQHPLSDLLAHPRIAQLAAADQIDAIVSGSGMHWVGDIVGALTQIKHALKPDGVFLGAVLGGDTLFELRTSLQLAEQERRGGLANRVSPMINPTDGSSLLGRAGFTLTTVDVEDLTIHYPSMWDLMSDLRDMGESNAILGRKAQVGRDTLIAADAIYKELYGKEDGTIPATFQIIFLIGWKPGPNEPKPLERGSATSSLKDVL